MSVKANLNDIKDNVSKTNYAHGILEGKCLAQTKYLVNTG